jgi:hypothetical protein
MKLILKFKKKQFNKIHENEIVIIIQIITSSNCQILNNNLLNISKIKITNLIILINIF